MDTFDEQLDHSRVAGTVDCERRSSTSDLTHFAQEILGLHVQDMRRAQLLCEFEFGICYVHCDYCFEAEMLGRHQRCQADRTESEDEQRFGCCWFQCVENSTGAGLEPAATLRCCQWMARRVSCVVRITHSCVQAHVLNVVVRILGHACFLYHRQFRKRRVPKEMGADGLAIQRPCRGFAIAIPCSFEIDIDEIPASSRATAATTGTCYAVCEGK
jgi:hypothetical protein